MEWNNINTQEDLTKALELSKEKSVVIYKHSTRCSISSMALNRLERAWTNTEDIEPFYLDLIAHRDLSQKIAEDLNVIHESPQLILVKNGKAIYNASHMDISFRDLVAANK